MFLDVLRRFKNKPLGFMALMHFVTFTFCLASSTKIGNKNRDIFLGDATQFLDDFDSYMYYGYFKTGYLRILLPPQVDGQDYGFNFINDVFVELCVYSLLMIVSYSLVTNLPLKKPFAHLVNSLRFVMGCSFAFLFISGGVRWWKQHNALTRLKNDGKDVDRGKFVHVLAWIFVVIMFVEMLGEYLLIVYCSKAFPIFKIDFKRNGKKSKFL